MKLLSLNNKVGYYELFSTCVLIGTLNLDVTNINCVSIETFKLHIATIIAQQEVDCYHLFSINVPIDTFKFGVATIYWHNNEDYC